MLIFDKDGIDFIAKHSGDIEQILQITSEVGQGLGFPDDKNGSMAVQDAFLSAAYNYLKECDISLDQGVASFVMLMDLFIREAWLATIAGKQNKRELYSVVSIMEGDSLKEGISVNGFVASNVSSTLSNCEYLGYDQLEKQIKNSIILLCTYDSQYQGSSMRLSDRFLRILHEFAWRLIHFDKHMTEKEHIFYQAFRSAMARGVESALASGVPLWTQLNLSAPTPTIPNQQRIDSRASTGYQDDISLEKTYEQIMNEIDGLIGLTIIKREVRELGNLLKVQQLRRDKGLPVHESSMHMVFYGNPGTGKTTIARKVGEVYKSLDLLSKGHLVETDRSGLVAGYLGQTAIKTKEVLETALGGILFIDEAYSLAQATEQDSFGKEAIDTIVKYMEDHRDDLVVIVAGYEIPMMQFISSNPGLRSRFTKYFYFPDYSANELTQIFCLLAEQSQYHLSPEVMASVLRLMQMLELTKGDSFGNGRLVRNIFERCVANQANRIILIDNASEEQLMEITAEDLRGVAPGDIGNRDECVPR